jgi:recombinational DNA repair protein (RecF pathway)
MPNSIYFVQECPTCGRSLQIRVEYLGRRMVCEHCHGRFTARDPANAGLDAQNDLLRRADELLESLDPQLARRAHHPR